MTKTYLLRIAGLATSATVALGLAVPAGAETKTPPRPVPAEHRAEQKAEMEPKRDHWAEERRAEVKHEDKAKHEAEMSDKALQFIRNKCEAAIARRLGALNAMKAHVEHSHWVTDDHQAELLKQIEAAMKGLEALKVEIASDTDFETLRADCRSIVEDYRVYLLMEPKVRLVLAAGRTVAIADKMGTFADKLQDRIDAAKAKGEDVKAAQAALDDMEANLEAATETAEGVVDSVMALEPQDYPDNRDELIDAWKSLMEAHKDLRAAHADARKSIAELKGLAKDKSERSESSDKG